MAEAEDLVKSMLQLTVSDDEAAVLDAAMNVILYTLNIRKNEWEKAGVEGTMFISKTKTEAEHTILIMNRLNSSNWLDKVSKIVELHLKDDTLLLYRNCSNCVYGLLFYDRDECSRITTLLNKLVKGSEIKRPEISEGVGGLHYKGGCDFAYTCQQNKALCVEHTEKEQLLETAEPQTDGNDSNSNHSECSHRVTYHRLDQLSATIVFQTSTNSHQSATGLTTTVMEKEIVQITSESTYAGEMVMETTNSDEPQFPGPFCGGMETQELNMFASSASNFAASEVQSIPVPRNAGAELQLCSTPCAGLQYDALTPVGPKPPLTKNQLWDVFNYLVENDTEFLNKLYITHEKLQKKTTM